MVKKLIIQKDAFKVLNEDWLLIKCFKALKIACVKITHSVA